MGYNTYHSNVAGSIETSYSTGFVSGVKNVGELVHTGSERATTSDDCFWDIETSGQATSDGGTGKTTADMQTASTFLETGWDFMDETENGTEDIWWILEEQDYPEFVWNFWAVSPYPEDGSTNVLQPLIVNWIVGNDPVYHDVYLGEDEEAVANATTESPGIYRKRQPAETIGYDPGILQFDKTYYWRIDEVNEANVHNPWKGKVWSFTTVDFFLVLIVDDFEYYTDYWTHIWQVWIDGFYNGTGSQIGYLIPPYAETEIVHGGLQSMPLFYNNTGDVTISEAVRTFDRYWNWTINGADTVTLYFRGEADNDPDTLYVAIEDSIGRIAVAKHPDADALPTTEWQKWHVSIVDMQAAGVDITAVSKIYIGVGDRNNPKSGGAGKIYIDDIWVTNRVP